MNGHFHKLKYIMILLVIILAFFLLTRLDMVQKYLTNPEGLKIIILDFGIFAPLAIIILQMFQCLMPLIPSPIITIAAGFIFGPWIGLLLSLIGSMIGSFLVFHFSRKYGKELVVKLLGKKELVHFHLLFRQKGNWGLYIARLIPIFPNEVVSLGAGLTKIPLKNFIIVSFFGFLSQMIFFSYFGAKLIAGKISLPFIVVSIVIIFFILIIVFRKYVKELLIEGLKELRKGEKLVKKEERFLEKEEKLLIKNKLIQKEEKFLEKEFRKI